MQRVTKYRGSCPVLILAPHGFDDPNTSWIAEQIITDLDAYGVINHGWERADHYDYDNDKANCNNILHIREDIVRQEFLEPIVNYVAKINSIGEQANIFIIHGVSNSVRKTVGGDALDIIIGYGEGSPPSHTCSDEYKNDLLFLLDTKGLRGYQGKAGGNYSARRKTNLNQLFFQTGWGLNDVSSVQIEIIRELREDEDIARATGCILAEIIKELLAMQDAGLHASPFNYPEI